MGDKAKRCAAPAAPGVPASPPAACLGSPPRGPCTGLRALRAAPPAAGVTAAVTAGVARPRASAGGPAPGLRRVRGEGRRARGTAASDWPRRPRPLIGRGGGGRGAGLGLLRAGRFRFPAQSPRDPGAVTPRAEPSDPDAAEAGPAPRAESFPFPCASWDAPTVCVQARPPAPRQQPTAAAWVGSSGPRGPPGSRSVVAPEE
ncbi:putative uncharacterized protein WWC2-AS2 [Canis lupus familiaris]|uniref:putative uncharacterized protein WWC2-AS2 n=1 Tax=Canis lupus dingo TaxID=286419 RepID=UPI000DC6B4DB|nr:putative uncharacterized protein WWC2-AS2 [Canis lupus dingo]XP_038303373.1 putative uncharacterized protein WWC2-AS2 [Canis lupus familiaris]XP_038441824.1 putative uncharacterized protein WWC2-AS2 [Canis lupus familiaris]